MLYNFMVHCGQSMSRIIPPYVEKTAILGCFRLFGLNAKNPICGLRSWGFRVRIAAGSPNLNALNGNETPHSDKIRKNAMGLFLCWNIAGGTQGVQVIYLYPGWGSLSAREVIVKQTCSLKRTSWGGSSCARGKWSVLFWLVW